LTKGYGQVVGLSKIICRVWKILLYLTCTIQCSKVLNISVYVRPVQHILTSNLFCLARLSSREFLLLCLQPQTFHQPAGSQINIIIYNFIVFFTLSFHSRLPVSPLIPYNIKFIQHGLAKGAAFEECVTSRRARVHCIGSLHRHRIENLKSRRIQVSAHMFHVMSRMQSVWNELNT
jgi:hypothetical protein